MVAGPLDVAAMDIGIDLIFSLDGIAVPPTKRDTHRGSQRDGGGVRQGGTPRTAKLKCEFGDARTGGKFAAAGGDSSHDDAIRGDVDAMASDRRTK